MSEYKEFIVRVRNADLIAGSPFGTPYFHGEIVRCRDCEHYDPHCTDDGVCFLPDGDGDFARWEVEPDGYCAWGERRGE